VVKVFRTSDFEQVATIETGALPHGLWPSGDGTRIYVGLENADAAAAIDTRENKVIATIPLGQAPQGVAYVPGAVPTGEGVDNLQPTGAAAQSTQLRLSSPGGKAMTQVTLFDQGLVQVLQAAVTGLEPKQPYVLALATQLDGSGKLEPIASFMTNPAGAAIVNTVGPIRQVVEVSTPETRRYLVIAPGSPEQLGQAMQVQMP
jgi:YVTN family beta-propeller protein